MEYPAQIDAANRLVSIFPDFTYDHDRVIGNDWSITLKHRTNPHATVHVRCTKASHSKEATWEFSACDWPRLGTTHFRPCDAVTVKVTQKRSDDAIRKDVQRRLLDWYYPELERQLVRFKEHEAADKKWKEVSGSFLSLLEYDGSLGHECDTFRVGNYGIDTIQTSANSVRLELRHLSYEDATKIVNFMKSFISKKR